MANNVEIIKPAIICLSDHSSQYLEVRHTPWNDAVLGWRTCEVIDFCTEASDFEFIFQRAMEFINSSGYTYVQARIEHNRVKRQAVERAGFYFAELSYQLSFHNPCQYKYSNKLRKQILLMPVESQEDINFVKKTARDGFHYGRLLEDININIDFARKRTENWIDTLLQSPNELLLAKHGSKLIGFHAQRASFDHSEIDWLLTGTASDYSMLSVPLWHSAFILAQERKFKCIKTMVSAANVGVLNLYNTFPFRVDRSLCGYHLLLNK